MSQRLRIVAADDESDMQDYFKKILPRLGYEVVSVASTGRELVDQCRALRPDLVITDIKMPVMDGIEAAKQLSAENPIPVILVSAYHNPELIERADSNHIMAFLVKPIKQADLEPAIALAMRRFRQLHKVQQEAADLRQALADRKTIERAKGILMKRTGLDEPAAFGRMQKIASSRNEKMFEVARHILLAEESFQPAKDL